MLYKILKPIVYSLLRLLFKFEVKGKKVFPKDRPFILASNHLSNLDPVILGAACPFRLTYLAKEELFKNKLFAIFIKKLGAIPIKREGADFKTLRLAIRIIQDKPIVIFPQGRRTKDYDNFKAGIGFIWKKTKVPVIVAKIYGTDRILPPKSKFLRIGKIKVIFDRVDGLIDDTNESIAAKIIDRIKRLR